MDLPDLTSPENLLWLLLLPILYWLARPPRPRQAVTTPHLAQWLRARDRLRRRPVRFRWLRFLLLLLAYAASVVALSGPSYGGREGPTALAVVLDASASMGAGRGRTGIALGRDFAAARLGGWRICESGLVHLLGAWRGLRDGGGPWLWRAL